jgi:hypothetical protein
VDHTRLCVDAVYGEPERTAPGSPAHRFLASFVGDEVGADQGVVLATQRVGFGAVEGRTIGVRVSGALVFPGSGAEAVAARPGEQNPKQRFEEVAGDTVTHVVNSVVVGGHAPGPVGRSRGSRFV